MICQTSTACGRLNAFQKVMLQWSSLHPYNATHVYKIAGPLRSGDLGEAVEATFRCHGLGIAHLSADGQSFRHETDTQPEVEVVAGGDDPESNLKEYLSRALNRPFERPTSHPFRFAAIDAGPQSHYVILAYDHWVADAYAARLVLRSVLCQYLPLAIPEEPGATGTLPGNVPGGLPTASARRGIGPGGMPGGKAMESQSVRLAGGVLVEHAMGRSITACTIPFRARWRGCGNLPEQTVQQSMTCSWRLLAGRWRRSCLRAADERPRSGQHRRHAQHRG